LRLLHISDTHYQKGEVAKAEFLASLTKQQPDLVVATGDLVSDDNGITEFLDAMSGLCQLPGLFVFGSNDYFVHRPVNPLSYLVRQPGRRQRSLAVLQWQKVRDGLVGAGWLDLTNARRRLRVANLGIEARGTGDAHAKLDDYATSRQSALTGGEAKIEPDLVIGVTHAPYARILDAFVADGLVLALAGHTHGGQICLPGQRAIITNCDLPSSMAKGLHRYPQQPGKEQPTMWLHVTAGIGSSPSLPLRTFCRPEACLLDITVEPGG